MDESILESVKAGSMTSDYTPFDQELIMYINTFLGVLNQLGVGKPGFEITDDTATWADFFGDTPWIPACKTWLKLRVMQIFDTSASSVKEHGTININSLNISRWTKVKVLAFGVS